MGGFNIDATQVESANQFARQRGVDDRCRFEVRDLNDVPYPFEDGSIAGVYEIGAICYSTNLPRLCKEVYRILEPGGRFILLDIRMSDRYDPDNPEHVRILRETKPLVGLLRALPEGAYLDAFEQAGLRTVKNENPSIDGLQVPLIEDLVIYFNGARKLIEQLAKWHVLPDHLELLFQKLNEGGESYIQFDRQRLGTIAQYIVAEKP